MYASAQVEAALNALDGMGLSPEEREQKIAEGFIKIDTSISALKPYLGDWHLEAFKNLQEKGVFLTDVDAAFTHDEAAAIMEGIKKGRKKKQHVFSEDLVRGKEPARRGGKGKAKPGRQHKKVMRAARGAQVLEGKKFEMGGEVFVVWRVKQARADRRTRKRGGYWEALALPAGQRLPAKATWAAARKEEGAVVIKAETVRSMVIQMQEKAKRSAAGEGSGSEVGGSVSEGEGSSSEDEGSSSEDEGSSREEEGCGSEEEGSGSEEEGSGSEEEGSSSEEEGSSSEDEGSGSEEEGSSSEDEGSSSEDEGSSSEEEGSGSGRESGGRPRTNLSAMLASSGDEEDQDEDGGADNAGEKEGEGEGKGGGKGEPKRKRQNLLEFALRRMQERKRSRR